MYNDSLNEECPQRLTYLKAWSPDVVLVGEVIQPCWRRKYITGVGFESLWPYSTSSSLSLPPIGVGDVITQLPAPASCCSASPTNLPPEPKVKEKKYPLPSTNCFGRGVWAQQQESKSAKVLSRAAAAHAHVRPNPLMLTVGMWCGVWSRGLGG